MTDLTKNVYAIDLGNTYSAIAWINPNTGLPEIIPDNETAEDKIASAVFFEKDGDILIGLDAEEEGALQPDRLLTCFKRWIGRNDEESRSRFIIDGEEKDPVMLSSIVLSKIKQYAMQAGHDVRNVVLTCPACYDWQQRDALKKAGQAAGLNVLAVICESAAAAVMGIYNDQCDKKTILVFDLGGGTFELSLLNVTRKELGEIKIQPIDIIGDENLGGIDWNNSLLDVFRDKCEQKYGIKFEEWIRCPVESAIERQKRRLSLRETTKLRVIDPYAIQKTELEVRREEFEQSSEHLLQRIKSYLNTLLNHSSINSDGKIIDTVLLVGRAAFMPMIRNLLIEQFGRDKIIMNPDAVVKGAAIIANMTDGISEADKSLWPGYPNTANEDIIGMSAVYAPPEYFEKRTQTQAP